ncbi:MAG: 30S ribosomal protein S6 [Spirochaetales bacterium]|nr:30S ribosomal protein S6 [Spirochaetales bacterium]
MAKKTKKYELIAIMRNTEAAHFDRDRELLTGILKKNGVNVQKETDRGVRSLHAEIDHQMQGHFLIISCEMDREAIAAMEHELKIHSDVLRFMLKRAA